MLETSSPLLMIVSLSSTSQDRQDRAYPLNVKSQSSEFLSSAYDSDFPTLMSSGRGFDIDYVIVLTTFVSPVTATFIAILDDCWRMSIICALTLSRWRLSISTSWVDVIVTRYPKPTISRIYQYPNFRTNDSAFMQEWETTSKRVKNTLYTRMRITFFAIRLELETSVNDMNITDVYCNKLWSVHCAKTLKGFNKQKYSMFHQMKILNPQDLVQNRSLATVPILILYGVVESFCSSTHNIVPHISLHDPSYHKNMRTYEDSRRMETFRSPPREFVIHTQFCNCPQ